MKKEKKENIFKTVYEKKETHLNAPIISCIGRSEIFIENYRGIIECNEELIKISTSIGLLYIEGENLWIKDFSKECLKVFGKFENISYRG
ncbi:MAG: YabP/YqfC family sporulation protein [Lachnospirales bacterium]